jgi:hypothetical protein
MRGTISFRSPWRCMTHLGKIRIVSLGSALVFSIIDNQEVNYPCLFAFNFPSSVLILLLSMHVLASVIEKKIVLVGDA